MVQEGGTNNMNKRLLTAIFSIVVIFSLFALVNAKTKKKETVYINNTTDIRSESQLNAYKNNSKKNVDIVKNKYKDKEVPLTVTFGKPISTEELEELVKKYSITIETFKIRAIDKYNSRVTLGGKPNADELVPTAEVDHFLKEGNAKLQGIIAFTGIIKVEKEKIDKLQGEENVYLVNMDSILLADSASKENKANPKTLPNVSDVYWYVEDYVQKVK